MISGLATPGRSISKFCNCHVLTKGRGVPGRGVLVAAMLMFLILAAAYIASIDIRATRGASITGDEPFYLLTTQSILQDGDLDLTEKYERRSYESFFDHTQGLWQQSVSREDGMLLSPHNPGLSVLLLPGFAAGGLLGAQVQLLLIAALTFSLVYLLAARVTGEVMWSWLATGTVGLSASAFIYATEVYPELPAALMLAVSLLLLQGPSRMGVWRALALAITLSVMVWLGIKYAPLAGVVALWALWRMDQSGRAVLLVAGVSSAAFFGLFHLRTFGAVTPYSIAVVYAGDTTLSVLGQHLEFLDRAYRLLGLLVDQRFGVGRWAPVLLLAVPGLALLWRQGSLARWVLVIILVQLLIATFVAITMMGWWFPGRTLMVVMPLFALPLTLLLARMSWLGRVCFVLLAMYTVAVTIALAIAGHTGEIVIAVDPFNMSAWIFRSVTPLFPNYTYWDARTWVLTVGWLLAAAASVAAVSPGPSRLFHGNLVVVKTQLSRLSGPAVRSWYTASKLAGSTFS